MWSPWWSNLAIIISIHYISEVCSMRQHPVQAYKVLSPSTAVAKIGALLRKANTEKLDCLSTFSTNCASEPLEGEGRIFPNRVHFFCPAQCSLVFMGGLMALLFVVNSWWTKICNLDRQAGPTRSFFYLDVYDLWITHFNSFLECFSGLWDGGSSCNCQEEELCAKSKTLQSALKLFLALSTIFI